MRSDSQISTPTVELRDIVVTYGAGASAVDAVRGISLNANQAEVLMLMGPSGSGKSSLLHVMGCLRKPTSGSVYFRDVAAHELTQSELSSFRASRIGFVFQQYNLLPSLCAWENVALALELRGPQNKEMKEIREQSEDVLARLGIHDRLEAYPDELSGGQKQRVAIARALVGRPDLILVDEPTAALDAKNGANVAEILSSVAHDLGHAVVIVTHDPRITGIADRILHLEDGAVSSESASIISQRLKLKEHGFHEQDDSGALGSRGEPRWPVANVI